MTPDRTALEAARDALPPLLTDDHILHLLMRCHSPLPVKRLPEGFREFARIVETEVRAALSSPPVLPAEPVAWTPLPEDPSERRSFNRSIELAGGDVRLAIAGALRIFGVAMPRGSFADLCAVMANEVVKLYAAPQEAAPALDDARAEYLRIGLLEWAVSRWRDEVQHRPLVNVHRRTLDDAWRQVIRHAGGDPDAIVGPSHDARLAAMQQEPRS